MRPTAEARRILGWFCPSHGAQQWAGLLPLVRKALRQEPVQDGRRCTWAGCTGEATVAVVDAGLLAALRQAMERVLGAALDGTLVPLGNRRQWN